MVPDHALLVRLVRYPVVSIPIDIPSRVSLLANDASHEDLLSLAFGILVPAAPCPRPAP